VCLPKKGIHTSTCLRLCIAASFFIFQCGDADQLLIIGRKILPNLAIKKDMKAKAHEYCSISVAAQ
jgi:hypothetical protein